MNQRGLLFVGFGLCAASMGLIGLGASYSAVAATPAVAAAQPPEGFTFEPVKMGVTGTPGPRVPRDWRLVAVIPPNQLGQSDLWFQDAGGNVYRVRGSTLPGRFVVTDTAIDQVVAN